VSSRGSVSSALSDDLTLDTRQSNPSTNADDDDIISGPILHRTPVSPGRLNTEWRNFFCNSLLAANPDRAQPPLILPTPASLPPSIRTAPNGPSGDTFALKPQNSFRLWSVNANGISSRDGFAELHTLCTSLQSRSVDAIALQEPNADFMQADICQKYEDIFREHFGQARVLTVTTCIAAPNSWKPGGVVLAILGSWSQHVTKMTCDALGRWASATLTGSDGNSITIYSVYNVVDTKLLDAGPSTVFSQQYRLLRLAGVTYPNPRKQFIEDLNTAISHSVANQESVVIVGDFNESLGKNPNVMASVCSAHDLFDVHAHFHGANADIPTYARGTTRLDYCVVSSNMANFVAAYGYNLFNEHLHSDHRAIFVDLKLKAFFGHATPTLARPDLRFVSSSGPDVTKFIRKMHAHLTENSAFHQFQKFRLDVDVLKEPWLNANKIDRVIGQAFLTAENHCSKHPKPPWSAKLHHASLKVGYWRTALTERRTKLSQTTVLRNLASEIWPQTPPRRHEARRH
jgi:endonuclease/exonuclease/phosphatase family metal-dependent hydrolase